MNKLMVMVEIQGKAQPVTIEVPEARLEAVLQAVRTHAGLGDGAHVFERDKDDELDTSLEGRTGISVIAHQCKRIDVHVRFEEKVLDEKFPPSATVLRVIRWAVGKKAFNLDSDRQAKANLMLPNADSPLPKDASIGRFVDGSSCTVVLDLTLKDFTNG